MGTTDVTDAQLAHEEDVFGFLAGLNQQPCGTVDGDETADAACARFALTNLIQEHFVAAYAAANDITVTDAQVPQTISQLDDQPGEEGGGRPAGRAPPDARRTSTTSPTGSCCSATVQTGRRRRQLTDADLRQQYQDGLASYTTVQVDHILVKTKAEAEDVYAQVTAPGATEQDFLDLAKQVSIDPSVKQNSGSLGSAVASTYTPPFADAVIADASPARSRSPSSPQFGWHVIRMNDEGRAVVRGR